jgi:hypothetical protein
VIVASAAEHTANNDASSVSVSVTFAVDERTASVHWIAAATEPSVDALKVAPVLLSGAVLNSLVRGHPIYLLATDNAGNVGVVVTVSVEDVVAPAILTSAASQVANVAKSAVSVALAFTTDESATVRWVSLVAGSSPLSDVVLAGVERRPRRFLPCRAVTAST